MAKKFGNKKPWDGLTESRAKKFGLPWFGFLIGFPYLGSPTAWLSLAVTPRHLEVKQGSKLCP